MQAEAIVCINSSKLTYAEGRHGLDFFTYNNLDFFTYNKTYTYDHQITYLVSLYKIGHIFKEHLYLKQWFSCILFVS